MTVQDAKSGLSARNLTVRFRDAQAGREDSAVLALDNVDVEVPQGRVLALLGPSGCGKSTALRVIAGLESASGRVCFDAEDITHWPAHRRGFSLMFQDGQLFGHLNVFENVAYGLRRRKVPRPQVTARVGELLELVGLSGFEQRAPATLSGGQQQRVALARALAPRPRLLLLDEPLSALDRTLRERLASDLRAVMTQEDVSALFVTHDHDEALTVADDVALMRAGRVVQTGPARQVWAEPVDAEAAQFLGYPTVLTASQAQAVGLAGGEWALRRTAWQISTAADALPGVVTRASGAGDLVNLTVALDALGGAEIESAVPAGNVEHVQVGAPIQLRLDAARAARLS